jgi:hypothetical protein
LKKGGDRPIELLWKEIAMPGRKSSLREAVDGLKRALDDAGRGRTWAGRVGRALAAVEQAVRRHRATLKDSEGRAVDVDTALNPSPTVDRRTDEFRQELGSFLREAQALREKVGGLHPMDGTTDPSTIAGALSVAPEAAALTDFGVFCERAEQLVQGLEHYNEEEAVLIQESVNLDLGAGD